MLSFRLLCLLSLASSAFTTNNALYGFDVQMLSDPKTPRMILANDRGDIYYDLSCKAMTWCLYTYLQEKEGKNYHSVAGYASKEHDQLNEFVIEIHTASNKTVLKVRDNSITMEGCPAFDQWTLVCSAWSGETGEIHYYLNGVEVGKGTDHAKGETIGKDGVVAVGQDQDEFDAGYEPAGGVYGRLTQFNSWDRVLTQKEVTRVMEGKMYGNQVDWRYSQWVLAGNALLLPTDAPNAALQRPTCKVDKATVATDLTICLHFNGNSFPRGTFTLFYYMNSYRSKELAVVVNETRSVSIVIGSEKRIIPHLTISQDYQHWCFVWAQDTLQVYIDGGLYDTVREFQDGMQLSSNGDLYVHEANSRKRIQAKGISYRVLERALNSNEVANEYNSKTQNVVPPRPCYYTSSDVRSAPEDIQYRRHACHNSYQQQKCVR